jgi:acyl-CoA synthetase (AMP-forming)/AMP-acid ligase II
MTKRGLDRQGNEMWHPSEEQARRSPVPDYEALCARAARDPLAFWLRAGHAPPAELGDELAAHVAKEIGPIARPERVQIVDALPKTRSGKIMRRVLRARAPGQPEGDLSTLEQ